MTVHCQISVYIVGDLILVRGPNEVSVARVRRLLRAGRIDGVRLRVEEPKQ